MHVHRSVMAAAGLAAAAALTLSACSSATKEETKETTASAETTTSMATTSAAAAPASLVGAGCAGYAEQVPTGPGSVEGMAADKVTVAASNSPVLTTLAGALSGKLNPNVNLVETLDNGEFTVFAPTDEAFAKLPPGELEALLRPENKDKLVKILTNHVVPGKALETDDMKRSRGAQTVAGEQVEFELVRGRLRVDGARVVGDYNASNGTVVAVDSVLLPN